MEPTSLLFNATLDFDTSNISGSMSMVESGGNPWDITSFNGTMSPAGQIGVTGLTGEYISPSNPITDNGTSLMLTGPNAEGVVGTFRWSAAATTAAGVFVVCQTGGC